MSNLCVVDHNKHNYVAPIVLISCLLVNGLPKSGLMLLAFSTMLSTAPANNIAWIQFSVTNTIICRNYL